MFFSDKQVASVYDEVQVIEAAKHDLDFSGQIINYIVLVNNQHWILSYCSLFVFYFGHKNFDKSDKCCCFSGLVTLHIKAHKHSVTIE